MFDRFRALSQQRQVVLIASIAAAIGVLLVAFWLVFLRTNYQPLFSNLDTADAAVIVAELDRKKVPYRLADGGATVLVPEDRLDSTRLSVLTEDLPLKGTVGFELFNKSDMGLTDFAQKINYQRALQGELARTIMTLDGVETARVHLSMGEDRIFRDDRVPPKASVTIRMKRGAHLSARVAQGIQRLIAGAVPKLDIADVVVLDEAGQVVGAPLPQPVQTVSQTKQELRAVEEYYTVLVREALEGAYPNGRFRIRVSASLSAEQGETGTSALSGWNPNARKFPLRVVVAPAMALDAPSQQSVRNLVADAVGTSGSGADTIALDAPQIAPPLASEATAATRAPSDALPVTESRMAKPPQLGPEEEMDWVFEAGLSLLLLLLIVGGFFFLIGMARGPRRLSERQRTAFASRLRAAMEQTE